jgi:hypothetical protein
MRRLLALGAVLVVFAGIAFAAVAGTASSVQTQFIAGAPTTRVGVHVVIKVTTTAPPGASCPGAPNDPDGEDPWGGCFPGASNTGVPSGTTLTAYAGPSTPATNAVIDSKNITTCLTISNANVTITNSHIEADCSWVVDAVLTNPSTADWLLIQNSEIVCVSESQGGVGEHNFIIDRVEISGGCANNVDGDEDFIVQDSYLHGLPVEDEIHHGDGIQSCCVDNTVINHTTSIGQDDFGGNTTSAIIMPQVAVTGTALLEKNLLLGGAFTLYCAPNGTDFRANLNVFGTRPGPYGAAFGYEQNCAAAEEFTGNINQAGTPIVPV